MTSGVRPLSLRTIDTTGANDGDFLSYDQATGRLVYKAPPGGIQSIVAGAGISIDDSDPRNPVLSATGGGSGGGSTGALLLDYGGSVPSSTPVRTLIFEEAPTAAQAILADSPAAFYKLDGTTGNLLDASGNARDMTPGAGIVRGKPGLVADGGFGVSGSGAAIVGSRPDNAGLVSFGTFEALVLIPDGNYRGGLLKVGDNANGWSVSIGGTTMSRQLWIGRNGINWLDGAYAFGPAGIYHIAVVRSGTQVTWYVNGALVSSVSTGFNNAGANMFIGWDGVYNAPAAVTFDNVAFFAAPLGFDQIRTHAAAAGVTTISGGCKGWWDGTQIQPLA